MTENTCITESRKHCIIKRWERILENASFNYHRLSLREECETTEAHTNTGMCGELASVKQHCLEWSIGLACCSNTLVMFENTRLGLYAQGYILISVRD